jgi:hypothetical protein
MTITIRGQPSSVTWNVVIGFGAGVGFDDWLGHDHCPSTTFNG